MRKFRQEFGHADSGSRPIRRFRDLRKPALTRIAGRERMAAIEKGVQLPPVEREVGRHAWNFQRILLLAGLIWISLGVTAFITLTALLAYSANARLEILVGIQYIAIAPVAIGLSHLVVYLVGKKKESNAEDEGKR